MTSSGSVAFRSSSPQPAPEFTSRVSEEAGKSFSPLYRLSNRKFGSIRDMKFSWIRTVFVLMTAVFWGAPSVVSPAQAQVQSQREYSQNDGKSGAQTSFLGVAVTDIDPDRASRVKLNEERGIEVTHVAEGSPADKAGIAPGDVLLSYNGENILSSQQFVRMVQETPIGRKVKIQLWRNEATKAVTAAIGSAPVKPFGIPANFANFSVPSMRYSPLMDIPTPILVWRNILLGAQLEELDRPMAQYFGVKAGVLVRSIEQGSPAAQAGLKVGDVITGIGANAVQTARDLSSYFRLQQSLDRATTIVATRDHKEVTLTLPPLEPRR
jgi:serine protease Do